MLNLLQLWAVRKWQFFFSVCIAKGGTEFWIYSSSGHKGNQHSERTTWSCLFCKSIITGFEGFQHSKSTQVEWKEKKMPAKYCYTGELSGKFHFRETTGKHCSGEPSQRGKKKKSSPHFAEPTALPVNVISVASPCSESDSKPLWMRTIIQSRQAETIPQGLYDVCRKAVQNTAGKWEREKKKKTTSAPGPASLNAETYKAKGQSSPKTRTVQQLSTAWRPMEL